MDGLTNSRRTPPCSSLLIPPPSSLTVRLAHTVARGTIPFTQGVHPNAMSSPVRDNPLRIHQLAFAVNFRVFAHNKNMAASTRLPKEHTIMAESIPSASEDPSRAPIPAGHPVTTWNLAGAERVESALRRPQPRVTAYHPPSKYFSFPQISCRQFIAAENCRSTSPRIPYCDTWTPERFAVLGIDDSLSKASRSGTSGNQPEACSPAMQTDSKS